MSYQIVSGTTQQFYHTVPSELDLITTTPTREGIFKYLSQIGYDKFPEFVLDILIKVEGHTPIDVTDGQGDEKQDILTINPKGERCLTQCKHTVDYKSHYNGNDLDLMVTACMRKNCKQAIFVTNSDLTPQGKKYINDEEYNRGFANPNDCPFIDYWNGFKIWERIKNNQDIINKWFSGLGQVHGLRSFKFDLTIQQLPFKYTDEHNRDSFNELLKLLISKPWVSELVEGFHYNAKISDNYEVHIKKWFQFTGGLDINLFIPEQNPSYINQPLFALTVEVILNDSIGKYSPTMIREKIINKISDEILNDTTNDRWWHIIASQIKSIIYLHDIAEPREIDLAQASTFVKTYDSSNQNELKYCSISCDEFQFIEGNEDSIWIHSKTGVQVIQMFEQQINPVEQYNYQITQYNQLKNIQSYNFYAIENIDSSMLMRIRRMLKHDWIGLQYNDDTLIWGIPPHTKTNEIETVHKKFAALNLKVLEVKQEDAIKMLENVQKDIQPSSWMFITELSSLSYPVLLNKRIFWLSKELDVKDQIDITKAQKLLQYKYSLENSIGFDNLQGKKEITINSIELREILFEIFSFRGRRMLDIAIYNNPISINVRFSEGSSEASNNLALKYIDEFLKIYNDIDKILN